MISVRWRPSSWMQFSSLFLKLSMTQANNWRSIGRISWRMASFKSFNVRGLRVQTRDFKYPQRKKITRWKIGRARRTWHVSEMGNEVPGKHVPNNGHWLVCSVRFGTILLKPHTGTVPPPGLPTEYYPFKRCQVPWVTLYKDVHTFVQ